MGKRAEAMQAAVLAHLRTQRAPQSAYDVLDALRKDARRLAPTTIYRALAALVESGAVHRLESRNAFVACTRQGANPADDHAAILSICDDCGCVEETLSKDVLVAVSTVAGQSGFAPTRHVIEVIGQCAACGAAGKTD